MNIQTEYWEPEALVAKLVVGARVRVRGFAECRLVRYNCHPARTSGMMGRLVSIHYPSTVGHRFEVTLETAGWGHYAAVELEPVEG